MNGRNQARTTAFDTARGLASSGMGLLQYFGAASDFNPWINQTHYGEAFANLRQRNLFATLVNIALAALVWLMMREQAPVGNAKRLTERRNLLVSLATGLPMNSSAIVVRAR